MTGFLGIEYSTNEIRNGRFVDRTLENDFLQTRYDILRQPGRRQMVDESIWRKNGEMARRHFLRMLESANSSPDFGFGREGDDRDDETTAADAGAVWNYHGSNVVEDGMQNTIETLIVEAGVEEIPDGKFKDFKNLKSIVFNEGLRKIGKNAFENCGNLTNIRLTGVEYIGDEAFLNCSGLVAIELGSDVQHVGMGAFKNCTGLASVTIPPNVTFIGDYAFANCPGLESATVMDGVVEVPAYCFQNDVKLERVMLPYSVEKIGDGAFDNCPNAEVYVPTVDMSEAESLLGTKMVARAEDDPYVFKTKDGYVARLYKDLY